MKQEKMPLLCRLGLHKWRFTEPWQTIGQPYVQRCARGCGAERTGIFDIERS